MTPARLAASCTALVTALLVLALPAIAQAGSYQSTACSPYGTPGLWTQTDSDPSNLTAGNQCGGPLVGPTGSGGGNITSPTNDEGALYGEDVLNAVTTPPGAYAGWTFTAPTGTTITAVTFYGSIGIHPGTADWVVGMFEADGTSLETCQGTFANTYFCTIPNNQTPQTFTGLNTSGLFFGIKCEPTSNPNCLDGGTIHAAQADMYSVAVTLTETAMPTISSESGPLWGGGVVSGTTPLTFSASDVSGIASWSISGQAATLYSVTDGCDYTQVTPCPQLAGQQQSVDTTRLPDGLQTVMITATNAAGNTSSAASPPVVVDNNGPLAPSGLTATPVGAGSDTVNLAWTNPASPPQPLATAYGQLCAASCTTPAALSAGGSGALVAPGPGTYSVRLWLIDTAGKGGSGVATTSVVVPPPPVGPTGPTGPSGPTGPTGVTGPKPPPKPAPAKPKPKPKLAVTHRLHGARLTVTVRVPAGVRGSVRVSYDAYLRQRRVAFAQRHVTPRRGVATVAFNLPLAARKASRLTVNASASGVHAVTDSIIRRVY